jgi:hypothetical protein
MGNVKQIDPMADEVLQTLTERLAEAQSGKIDGFVMLSVYKKSGAIVTDLKGQFSMEPDDLAALIGYLDLMGKDLYRIATEPEDDE